jgi:Carboxypeptidase regulatory-like domain
MVEVRFRCLFVLLVAAILAAVAVPAFAAADGEVDGVVQDAQGKPQPGVEIALLKAGDQEGKKQVSGADGGFKFNALASGVYIASASLEGYAPVTCRGIRLVAGQTRRLEIKLQPAGGEQPSSCIPAEPGT